MSEKIFLTQYFVDRVRDYAKVVGKSDAWVDNWVEEYVEIVKTFPVVERGVPLYYDEGVTYEYPDMRAFMQEIMTEDRKRTLQQMYQTSTADIMRGVSPEHLILDEAVYNFDTRSFEEIPERVIITVVDDWGRVHHIEIPNIQL